MATRATAQRATSAELGIPREAARVKVSLLSNATHKSLAADSIMGAGRESLNWINSSTISRPTGMAAE